MFSLLIALTGCSPTGEINTDPTPEDTASPGETGEVVQPEPDPEPDYSVWIGERMFITDDCKEPATEVGHELTAENWNDYEDLDVKGKIVLVLRREPGPNDPKSPFNGTDSTEHAYFTTKAANAAKHGIRALLRHKARRRAL